VLDASLVGGFYSLTLLLKPLHPLLSFALRLVVCIVLRIVADGFGVFRTFLKGIFVFLLLNGLYGGLMLLCRLFVPQMLYSSGVVYLDVRIPFLLLSTLTIYLIIRAAALLFVAHPSRTHVGTVTLIIGDQSVDGKGVFDTGDHLTDGFTGKPVLIARSSFVSPIVPRGVAEFLEGKDLSACTIPRSWQGRLRLFPYSSLGADGLLPAFRCDRVLISHLTHTCVKEKMYIAVSPRPLYHGETDVLFPAALYDEITEGENKHDLHNTRRPRMDFAPSIQTRFFGSLHQRAADSAAGAEKAGGGRDPAAVARRRRNRARSADRT
jgi:sigma-E processing peptidase SpoIIGA